MHSAVRARQNVRVLKKLQFDVSIFNAHLKLEIWKSCDSVHKV